MLTPRLIRLALWCISEELEARRKGKAPVRPWLVELIRALELELAVSLTRQQNESDLTASGHEEWIGTSAAAAQLGCDIRTIQRHAPRLGGRKVGGRWILPASAVREHADGALTDGRDLA